MRRDELSFQEREDFLRKVRESEKKRKEQNAYEKTGKMIETRSFDRENYEQKKIEERRARFIEGFGLSLEDKKVLSIFKTKPSLHNLYLTMNYLFVAFDFSSFVEKSLSKDMSIKSKFYYIFGADLDNDVLHQSQKSVLYQICKKIYDFMGQAQGPQDKYSEMESLNQYLALIGCLLLAVPYEQSLLSNNFVLGFNPNRAGNRYCMMIPPKDIESELFKDVYDFYMNNIPKVVLRDMSKLKKIDDFSLLAKEKAQEGGVFTKMNRAVMQDYDNSLSIKLDSLRRKGGKY